MSVKIRGYKWQFNYRGFDIFFREYSGHSIAYLDDETAARMGVESSSYDFGSLPVEFDMFDEFWAEIGH